MKKCRKCNIEKDYLSFYKRKVSKDGFSNFCKKCSKDINRIWKKNYMKKYRIDNIKELKEYQKQYELKNKDKRKKYNVENKEKINKRRREYQIFKTNTDPLFKLKRNVRNIIYKTCRNNRMSKKTQEILGCTFEEFKLYLESKFESWMNWENRGLYNGELNYGWDIDHIIPLCSIKNEEDIIKLNHYTNLQPLCSKINRDLKYNKF